MQEVRVGRPSTEADPNRVASFWSARASSFDGKYDFANFWDRLIHQPLRIRHEAAMASVHALAGPSVCDVGCGSGRQMAAAFSAGAIRCVGVDLSPEMTALARARLNSLGFADRSQLHTADALTFTTNEHFDLVWALGVFDYVEEPVRMLRKLAELSRNQVLVTFRRLWAFRSPFRKLTYRLKGQPIYLHAATSVRRAMLNSGLHDVTVERLTAGLYIARGSVHERQKAAR